MAFKTHKLREFSGEHSATLKSILHKKEEVKLGFPFYRLRLNWFILELQFIDNCTNSEREFLGFVTTNELGFLESRVYDYS